MNEIRIYLAGGFKSGWQDCIMEAFEQPFGEWLDLKFVDPRQHGLKHSDEYTERDLRDIGDCDIFFAVIESDNPAGANLFLEMGYAKALSKQIVFCELGNDYRARYYSMARSVADYTANGLGVAVMGLKAMIKARRARSRNPVSR